MRNLELAVLIFEKYKINQYLSRWNGIDLVMKDSKYYFGFDKQFLLPIPYETAEAYSTGMLTGELIGRGYHSFEWDYDFNRELLFLDLYSKKIVGRNMTECLCRAIIYDERKNKTT